MLILKGDGKDKSNMINNKYHYYKKKSNTNKIIRDIILIYFLGVIFVSLFNSMLLQAYKIPTDSMEPTIKKDTCILVNKFITGSKYPFTDTSIFDGSKNIKSGDIIVFTSKEYLQKNKLFRFFSNFVYTISFSLVDLYKMSKIYDTNIYVKRVIGLPNDVISYKIVNGKAILLINGIQEVRSIEKVYDINEENDKNTDSDFLKYSLIQNDYVVPADQFYVLGDNRVLSVDSRIFGAIDKKQILGKAILKYWPSDSFGMID